MNADQAPAPLEKDSVIMMSDPGEGRWRLRFWTIFGGQVLSLCGSSLTQFVLMWWIADTTGSVAALSVAGLAALLPHALFSPLGGVLADRYSRRVLMALTDIVSALCMVVLIALFLTERVEMWHVYLMMAIRGAMQALQEPAAVASLGMLVPRSFLSRVGGLQQTLQSMTQVVAAPLGALAMSVLPLGWALSIDVVTALFGIVPLLIFRIPQNQIPAGERTGVWREFRDGIGLVRRSRGLRHLFLLLAVGLLAVMPSLMLVPLLVKEHFGGGAGEVALMEGLSGFGMIAGGMIVTAFAPRRQVPWVLWGMSLSCLTLALTGLAPAGLFGVAVLWWVLSGLTYSLSAAPCMTLLQMVVPNHLLGRTQSLLNTMLSLAAPVGLVITALLSAQVDVRALFVMTGAFAAIVTALGFLSPALMTLEDTPPR
ncbi:Major facilitator superfamily MFS_1 [Rhodospirillum rubrum ATCC 11170]|uniref:Major facilitator superfamily MFS_1 n=2 Tax=Rhodospirillum rubrum TaxID=1085 RepID=Q2RQ73_RHORT|nr:Major facilitator superfamily MFS_1 [Rhodospirillum rubrum ATCC 11170]MBK5955398.1 MFS transporter [Rhodospirillum rubrum]HAP98920.1 MFS transporter [Rhodospirillum rubrum]HCF17660.1 MFS transporter [Rhodospirillum rubrum]